MNPTNPPDYFAMSQSYSENVQNTRHTMNQMLNIIREQDRAMRDVLRDTERAMSRPERYRINSPTLRPYSTVAPGLSSASQSYNIPYAPPRPSLENNLFPLPRPTSLASDMLGTSFDTPSSLDIGSHNRTPGYQSMTQRFQRYRELSNTWDPLPHRPGGFDELGALAGRRRLHERYPNLADLSPVTIRPTLTEMAAATRDTLYGELDNAMNTECPITREAFTASDRVIQICQCRHVFSADAGRLWFETNVRCPICRHDVRQTLDVSGTTAPVSSSLRDITIASTPNLTTGNAALSAVDDDRPLATIVAERLRGTPAETDSAADSIMRYITNDIETRLQEYGDSSGNVMIEYGFVVPNGATEPVSTSVQVRDVTTEPVSTSAAARDVTNDDSADHS